MAAFITDLRSVTAGIIWSPALIMGGAGFAPVAAPFPYIIVPPFLSGGKWQVRGFPVWGMELISPPSCTLILPSCFLKQHFTSAVGARKGWI